MIFTPESERQSELKKRTRFGRNAAKDTKFINCRIGPFWRAVWLVIWAVRKRIFQLLAGSRDDYQVSSAGGGGDALYYPGNKEGHIPTRSASEGPMKSSESRRGSPLDG